MTAACSSHVHGGKYFSALDFTSMCVGHLFALLSVPLFWQCFSVVTLLRGREALRRGRAHGKVSSLLFCLFFVLWGRGFRGRSGSPACSRAAATAALYHEGETPVAYSSCALHRSG